MTWLRNSSAPSETKSYNTSDAINVYEIYGQINVFIEFISYGYSFNPLHLPFPSPHPHALVLKLVDVMGYLKRN